MIFLWIVLTLFVFVLALVALLLFSPVVTEVDTRSRRINVRWSPLLTYARPLPGTKGPRRLFLAGVPITFSSKERKRAGKKKERTLEEGVESKRRQRKQARLVWSCLLDDDVRGTLIRRFRRLPADLWDSVEVTRCRSEVSLPDPALNGLLWGALSAVNSGQKVNIQCNFMGRNEVQAEVRLYPHRVAKAFLLFFLRLPYRAVYRHWSAS